MATGEGSQVIDVWSSNFEQEMNNIVFYTKQFPFVFIVCTPLFYPFSHCCSFYSLQHRHHHLTKQTSKREHKMTFFLRRQQNVNGPGLIVRPFGDFLTREDMHYQTMRTNVELTKVLQIALTVADDQSLEQLELPCWCFNFHYDETDAVPENLLKVHGDYFAQLHNDGIDPTVFAEWLYNSGLLLNSRLQWVCFNGLSDFGYLLRFATNQVLPPSEEQFVELMHLYFPHHHDARVVVHLNPAKAEPLDYAQKLLAMRQNPLDARQTLQRTQVLYAYARKGVDETLYSNVLYGLTQAARLISQH